ncbi:putative gamma-butyrolactone autoregulator receptor [Streptomyces sp. NBRC 110611]|uniref:ScbR family autoregulator-binding transcription factor n=1 Tax=Streptomyces sp. NBRC 110611 TaxID=1621259 RepID=UPI00083192C9|nr:ScbR family autoregulator-binding transcription factor [Streptomyces sp. NBRC 110611]GAU66941.1 putative gamma-butyrolactone autoregulator receptor [Streptomyces sp. NBRC 110611]
MVKQARAVRTRRAVLEAAAHVIGHRGYQAATMAEIIQRAGVTKGAVYFHFTSKDALARAVITEQTDPFLPRASESRLQDTIDFTHEVALALRSDPLLQAATRIAVETTFSEEPLAPYRAWTDIVTELFSEARERGELLPGVAPDRAAEFFVAAYMGVQLFSRAATDRADLPERVTALWRHLLPGLAAPGALSHLDPCGRGARVSVRSRPR